MPVAKSRIAVAAAALGMIAGLAQPAAAQSAEAATPTGSSHPLLDDCTQVLEGVQRRFHGYDSWRRLKVTITDEGGATKVRRLASAHKSFGVNRYMRSVVIEPVELVGIESFSEDNTEGDLPDRVWTWLPSRKAAIELKSEDMSQRVFGSDLAVGEMMTREARDYECRMMGVGDYLGHQVYKIYVKPKDEREVMRVGLNDGEVWADTQTFLPLYSSFNADAPNEQRIFEVLKAGWTDGVFAASHFRVSTMKEGRIVSFSDFETETESFNIGLPDGFFSPEDLGSADSAFRDFSVESETH